MPCQKPYTAYLEDGRFFRFKPPGIPIRVACRRCRYCRLRYASEWAIRCTHEAHMHGEDNCFVTLTYRDSDLPGNGSLVKKDHQDFLKRLRKAHPNKKIRYFHCGEYGTKLRRPHYHTLFFGYNPVDQKPRKRTKYGVLSTSEELSHHWRKGFVTVAECNWRTAAYTARYSMKKVGGEIAAEHYRWDEVDTSSGEITDHGLLLPEYCTMSRGRKKGEGIGGPFYDKYSASFHPEDKCVVKVGDRYRTFPVPAYYDYVYSLRDPDGYAALKEKRAAAAKEFWMTRKQIEDAAAIFNQRTDALNYRSYEHADSNADVRRI